MKKLILDKDIVLTQSNTTNGASGEVIVQQDQVGNHIVVLGDRNIGDVEVLKQPGAVTLLTWRNDDVQTYWNKTALTPEALINPPATINDLVVLNIDSIGVVLRWTAPNGNAGSIGEKVVPVDKYKVKISNTPISPIQDVGPILEYKQNITPKAPGQQEQLILTNLKPDTYYAVCLVTEKIIFGTKRVSPRSNIITFRTLSANAEGPVPVRIELDPRKSVLAGRYEFDYERTSDYDLDLRDNIIFDARWPTDYSKVTNTNGKLFGNPDNMVSVKQWGTFFTTWYNTRYLRLIFELDGVYNVEKFYYLGVNGQNFDFRVSTSQDMVNWTMGVDMTLPYSQNVVDPDQWASFDLLQVARSNVKYIALEIGAAAFQFKGLAFYGKKAENSPLTGTKFKRALATPLEWIKGVGTNGFFIEDLTNMAQIGHINRFYNNFNWFFPDDGRYGKGSTVNVNALEMQFSKSRMWNFDSQMQLVKSLGMEILFTMNDELLFLAPADYAKDPMYRKSVNRGLNANDLSVTLAPASWSTFARVVYNFVARYGSNTNADTQYLLLAADETALVGLNLVTWFEWGNELDKYWKDQDGYYNPQELAVRCSVAWDGHKGLLGAGAGMLAADPNSKQIMPGLSCTNTGYVREMLAYWDKTRGQGDYPIHALNVHYYNTNYGSQNFNVYDFSIDVFGTQPEWSFQREVVKRWVEMRDKYAPGMELWMTEIGYDEHNDGCGAPNIDDVVTRHVTKAQWQIRSFLLVLAYGFDRLCEYFFRHTNGNDIWAQDSNSKARDLFMTSGYMVPLNSAQYWESIPTEAWWYMTAFRNEFAGYRFLHLVREYGSAIAADNPIETYHPNMFALAFEKISDGSKVIVAWLAPLEQASALNQQKTVLASVLVKATEANVDLINFNNAHVSKTKAGNHSTVASTLGGDSKTRISVTITETPVIIKTENVGVKKLINPVDFIVQPLSTTSVKLVWTDKNIGLNKTKIFQSAQPDSNFVLIYNNYIDTADYVISGLTEGTAYYYKIQFELDGALSDETAIQNVQMGVTIPVPSNFATTLVKSTSIALGWDYTDPTGLVTKFELFRSSEAAGLYNKVGEVVAGERAFTDFGLVPNTNYFYKIRAKGEFAQSLFSLALATTTSQASDNPPVLQTSVTSYSGDTLLLSFDLPMSSPAGNGPAFTVIEYLGGIAANNPSNINVVEAVLHDTDTSKIILRLANQLQNKTSDIRLSYNGTTGTVQSQFAVKLASFTNRTVTNNFENEALVVNRYKVRITDGTLTAAAGWNDAAVTFSSSGNDFSKRQPYVQNMQNDAGGASTRSFLVPVSYFAPVFEVAGYSEAMSQKPGGPYPVEKWFPGAVVTMGVNVEQTTAEDVTNAQDSWTGVVFTNLDISKQYNIRVLVSRAYWDSPKRVRAELFGVSNSLKVFDCVSPDEKGIYFSNIKPYTVTIPPLTETGAISLPNMDKPKVAVRFQGVAFTLRLEAVILEELMPL